MKFTKSFKDLPESNVSIIGGKGSSLGEMTNAKISTLPRFIVLALAYERFS